ncbi:dihydrodipicolinate synthase family protein [Segetibacter koreensis]|uniref:dihydrodipicolinate synthase family protein n=1 Tax=Segetibacter koreensis TaxID=398037 RepID=UPI00037D5F8F|nr:dihydrodipicolinate synthase family protein [Segetibacter koreensis]
MKQTILNTTIKDLLHNGTVIPAHPLVLDENRMLDEERQRRLTRYYMAAGAGGVAVGVHTTQFEIRKPEVNLLETVLKLAAEEIDKAQLSRPFIKVAGIVGPTANAIKEAQLAVKYGYHFGLVSLGGLKDYSETDLIEHIKAVAEIIAVFGFYLQPAVGGRILSFNFWKQFVEIPNVSAIKVAAFNRYQTLDVVRAVCSSVRRNEIALYTGNDDNIVADLLTPYRFHINGKLVEKRFVGGLLGHWAVWTKKAVELHSEIKKCLTGDGDEISDLLAKGIEITDMNEVIFDARNSFHGCIPGIHEVLRRQGLLEGRWCLNPHEEVSPGQLEEIDRLYEMYQENTDDAFVKEFLEKDKKQVESNALA